MLGLVQVHINENKFIYFRLCWFGFPRMKKVFLFRFSLQSRSKRGQNDDLRELFLVHVEKTISFGSLKRT